MKKKLDESPLVMCKKCGGNFWPHYNPGVIEEVCFGCKVEKVNEGFTGEKTRRVKWQT